MATITPPAPRTTESHSDITGTASEIGSEGQESAAAAPKGSTLFK